MTTIITDNTVETDDLDGNTLSGSLTNGQLVQGLLDGDLTLNSNGEVVIEGRGTFAQTNVDETITGAWDFQKAVDCFGTLNMQGDKSFNAGDMPIKGVGDPQPFGPMNAVNKRYAENELPYLPFVEDSENGHYNAGGRVITGVGPPDPNGPQNATNKRYVDRQDEDLLPLDGSRKMNGEINMDTHPIVSLADPSGASQAATKRYVDNQNGGSATTQTVGGMSVKDSNNNVTRML